MSGPTTDMASQNVQQVTPTTADHEALPTHVQSLQMEYKDNSQVPQLSILDIFWFFLSTFGIFAWGGSRSFNRTHQRTSCSQRAMDNNGAFQSCLRRVPNPSWARSYGTLHVFRVLGRRKMGRACSRTRLPSTWLHAHASLQLHLRRRWVWEYLL